MDGVVLVLVVVVVMSIPARLDQLCMELFTLTRSVVDIA